MYHVYIASPYSSGGAKDNVARQVDAANLLLDHNFVPIAPLLMHHFNLEQPRPYEFWMGICISLLERADAILRLPGISPGADREVRYALDIAIPVFPAVHELLNYRAAGKLVSRSHRYLMR